MRRNAQSRNKAELSLFRLTNPKNESLKALKLIDIAFFQSCNLLIGLKFAPSFEEIKDTSFHPLAAQVEEISRG